MSRRTPEQLKADRAAAEAYVKRLLLEDAAKKSAPTAAAPPPPDKRLTERGLEQRAEVGAMFSSVESERRRQRSIEALRQRLSDPNISFEEYTKAQAAIGDIERGFEPGLPIDYAGETPAQQGEEFLLGIPATALKPAAASTSPINVPRPAMTTDEVLSDIFKPQIVAGPASKERAFKTTGLQRAQSIFPEEMFIKASEGKSPDERAALKVQLESTRAAFADIADSLGPDYSDDDVLKELRGELDDLPKAVKGEGRLGTITQEPNAAGIERLYARQTAPGAVPNLSKAQRAYLQTFYHKSYPLLERKLKEDLTAELRATEVPDVQASQLTEADVAAGGAGATAKVVMRKRTDEEVSRDTLRLLPERIARMGPNWWETSNRDQILSNPEKYATKEPLLYGGATVYPTGATREGVGARNLRMIMAPFNVLSTGLSTGAARLGEDVARLGSLDDEAPGSPSVPSLVDTARARRTAGTKAAALPKGFVGDIAESVLMNRGATQTVKDLYEEMGYNEYVGAGLGLGLDILTPPMGGIVSAATRGTKAALASRAARAAGLIGGVAPTKAFAQGARAAFNEAWAWRNVGSVLPGSLKIQAAEDTGRMFALREILIDASANAGRLLSDAETMAIVRNFAASNEGGGSLVRMFEDAAKSGRAADLAQDVQKTSSAIVKGDVFSGAQKLVKFNDDMAEGLIAAANGDKSLLSNVSAQVLGTVVRNAAARSDKVIDALAAMDPKQTGDAIETLLIARSADPLAVNRAIAATTAFDAFNQAQKARGFAEFGDLVLVSNRYIATPDKAVEAMERAAATPTGKFIRSVLDGKTEVQVVAPTAAMLETNPNRAVQVVSITPAQSSQIQRIADAYERSGVITSAEADYARALLKSRQVSLDGLRYLANGNMDLAIAGRGGFDIKNIKTVPNVIHKTYTSPTIPIYGKPISITPRGPTSEVTAQAIAKQRIFTPPQMRSVFDGMATRATSMFTDSQATAALLDVPPTTMRAVEDFYAQVTTVNKRIKSLYDDLQSQNPKLRAAYGLPQTGPLTNDEVLAAVARGPGGREAGSFIDQVVKQSMIGYSDVSSLASQWTTRTFFTNAVDGSFTARGAAAMEAAKVAAVDALKSGRSSVAAVVGDLRAEIGRIVADPNNTTATYRLTRTAPMSEDQIPDVIGGALFLRDVDILKSSVASKLIDDDAYAAVQKLLPPNISSAAGQLANSQVDMAFEEVLGFPVSMPGTIDAARQGQKVLFQGAIIARQKGYAGSDGLIYGMVEHVLKRELGTVDPNVADAMYLKIDSYSSTVPSGGLRQTLDQHAPAYFQAAEQAMLRAGMTGDSVQDVIDAVFSLSRGGKLPVTTVTGRQLQDSIDTFMSEEAFKPVLEQIVKNMPKDQKAAQRVLKWASDTLEFLGNVRYNLFLYTRPAYHTGNAVTGGNIIHSALGIENSPAIVDFTTAVRTMERGIGKVVGRSDTQIAFTDQLGRTFTFGDLRRAGVDSGLFKTEQQVLFSPGSYEEVIKDAKEMGLSPGTVSRVGGTLASMPADVANSTDNFFRMASFIGALRRGAPIEVAQEVGKKSLFDYGSLIPAERAFASRFFIFYTFSRLQAENVVKMLGSVGGAARFVRQAAVTRDLQSLAYEMSGGKDYDIRRFYMKDKDLAKIFTVGKEVGMSEYMNFSPSIPALDSFMQISALLYGRNPIQAAFNSETGGGQFVDPFLKQGIAYFEKRPVADEEKRADRLRLMSPEHVAALTNAGMMPNASVLFGDMTPILPSRETTKTYNGYEWQLTPEAYDNYKLMRTIFQLGGVDSSVNYWAPILDVAAPGSEQNIMRPGKAVLPEALGLLKSQARPTLSDQERAVLRLQEERLGKRTKAIEEQEALKLQQDLQRQLRGAQ